MPRKQNNAKKRNGGNQKRTNNNRRKTTKSVNAPAAISARSRTQKPTWTSSPNGSIKIRHREQFSEVYRPSATADYATIFSERINPGNSSMFPWLAGIAPSWETYKFSSLRFEYVPSAPTTAPGTVVLTVDYDPTDATPEVKRDLLQMDGSTSAGLWVPQTHVSTRANLSKRKELYVTEAGPPDRLNDAGKLIVGIFGTEDDTSFAATGDLWVSYDIDLITPQPRANATSQQTFFGHWTTSAGSPASDFARHTVFADINGGALAATTETYGEAAFPSPAGLTFPEPGDYVLTIRMFAGESIQNGGTIASAEVSGFTTTPVTVIGQQSGVVLAEDKLIGLTPDYNASFAGAKFAIYEVSLKTYAPYTSFQISLASVVALCGVLYVRIERNSFLDEVRNTPLLPS